MDSATIKQVLLAKGVKYLYHANTVTTSLSFFEEGGLLSRGAVEDHGLDQTMQKSDGSDRTLGVWYDVFFDTVDIHTQSSTVNFYGPVTFIYSLDVLDAYDESVKITRSNPQDWSNDCTEAQKYLLNESSLDRSFNKYAFGQHVIICDVHEAVPFDPYLKLMLLEHPGETQEKKFNDAFLALRQSMEANGISAPLLIRDCPQKCKCQEWYANPAIEKSIYYRYKCDA